MAGGNSGLRGARTGAVLCALVGLAAIGFVIEPLAGASAQAGWNLPVKKSTENEPDALSPEGNLRDRSGIETTAPAGLAPGTISNLGLLDHLTRSAVVEIADSLNLEPGRSVTLCSTTWHEANWFVACRLAEVLADRGVKVRLQELAAPPEGELASAQQSGAAAGQQSAGRQPAQGSGEPGSEPAQPEGDATGENPIGENPIDENGDALGDTTGAYADSIAAANADPLWGSPAQTGAQTSPGNASSQAQKASHSGGHASSRSVLGGSAASSGLPQGECLDIRIMEFGVGYSDARRTLLFGPLRFTRVGGVYVQVSHMDELNGDLRRSVTAQRHQVDRLSGGQKALAEGASYPFTNPQLQAPSLGRYIEPAVVVAIVSSLVYLFYTNQN